MIRCVALVVLASLLFSFDRAVAQAPGPGGPPAVGIVRVEKRPITETSEFVGRIEATDRVALVARVTAYLEKMLFTEGAEVKKNDLLYVLEQPPFQADVQAKQAAVQQAEAQLQNANITLQRALALLHTPAGQQSNVDNSKATALSDAAQVLAAQAQLRESEINLGYTEIRAPINGKIGRTAVTIGNVVSPSSGTLTTIVSQDPMYVTFPIPVRAALELRERYAEKGGFSAVVIRIRLPDGRIYDQKGELNFVNNTISSSTDTILLRGTIPNPPLTEATVNNAAVRELGDGEFVTVLLEGVEPVEMLAIPRAAVLSDQQGDYVLTVGADNKVQQARIQLGQSTPTVATVASGLSEGQMVILDGLQRVRPGQVVSPGPASPAPGFTPTQMSGEQGGTPAGNAQAAGKAK
jgi:membrane fusion protein (multidrug efflux system)